MIDPANREALEDLMTLYVLGELRGDDARDLEQLIRERSELRVEIAALQRTFGLMPYAAVTEPPPELRARILAAGQSLESAARPSPAPISIAERARESSSKPVPRIRSRGASIARVVGSIAALLIIALTWDGYRLRQELRLQQDVATTLQQPDVVHQFALRGDGIAPARGTVVLDLDTKRAAVAIHGLPKLPAGQVYRLWARVGDGTVPCGQFNADANGAVTSQFAIPVDAYTSPVRELFLNVEPAEQGPKPVGRTVMVST